MTGKKTKPGTCEECGKVFAPERLAERLSAQLGERAGVLRTCPDCRRRKAAGDLLDAAGKEASQGDAGSDTSETKEASKEQK